MGRHVAPLGHKFPDSVPPSLRSRSLISCALRRSSKYQMYNLWFGFESFKGKKNLLLRLSLSNSANVVRLAMPKQLHCKTMQATNDNKVIRPILKQL